MAERSITEQITVEAPRAEVARALTDADALEHWLATNVESDARTGGRFRYTFEFEDPAQNNVQQGQYSAVEDDRVELPWVFPFSDRQTTVSYGLVSEDGATRVVFEHRGFDEGEPWDGAYERFTGGWRVFLEGLKRYVETGDPSLPFGMKPSRA